MESLEASGREIGASSRYSGLRRSSKVVAYFEAVAAYHDPNDQDPAGLRRDAIRALARVVRDGDGREVPMAAKVLQDYLPKGSGAAEERIADMSTDDVVERLEEVLSSLGDRGLRMLKLARLEERRAYGRGHVPVEGTAPPSPPSQAQEVIDVEALGPADEGSKAATDGKKGSRS